jgi:hypothetical protein
MKISIGNNRFVRCFKNYINLKVSNSGNTPAENVSAIINLPAPIVIKSSSHTYTNLGNNTLKFSLGNLPAGQSVHITLEDSVSCQSVLGETFQTRAYAYTTTGCIYPELSSDTAYASNTIVGSYDPNDKHVYPSAFNFKDYNSEKKTVDFTINFQNTGNAEAYKVVVTDTISDKLDFTGFQENAVSHKAVKKVISSNPLVIQWVFDNINLAAKSVNEKASMGYISFSLPVKEGLTNNTKIENRAAIYFDYNDPIITNTASVIISDTVNTEVFILNNQENLSAGNFSANVFSPNPVIEKSKINLPAGIDFPVELTIFSNSGKLVKSQRIENSATTFDKENLTEGIYHFVISNDKESFSGNILVE